jgi:hypothetical protein
MNELVPIRWPRETEWLKPASLALLDRTPVNCVVLPEAPADFVAAAKAKGIQVVAEPPAVLVDEPVWPGVQTSMRGSNTSDAGPTGPPWADANGWKVMLARLRSAGKPVWVGAEPPADRVLRPEHYALAVADAEAYGGRWLISPDAALKKGLLAGDTQAKETWATLTGALRFFDARRQSWSALRPLARLGIASSFEGEDEFIAAEVLNLAARRHVPYRAMLRPHLDLQGLSTVLWIHAKAPEGAEKKALTDFVAAGGTLVLPASAAHMTDGLAPAGKSVVDYRLYASGKGRIAVAAEPWSDPWVVVSDVNRMMTRRADLFRLWNAGASNAYLATDGKRVVAHVLNFTGRPAAHPMSLWLARAARSVVFYDLFGRAEKLPVAAKNEGVEVSLPPFASYAAVEFGEGA